MNKAWSWIICGFCLSGMLSAAVKQIPLRDFFRNPEKSGFKLSPDGTYISFLQPYESRMNVFVQKRESGQALRITSETARDIPTYFWKGNNRIVYVKDFKGDENFHVVTVDRDGKNLKDLTPFPGVRADIIDDLHDNENEMIIGLNKRNPQIFDAYRIDLASGEMRLIAENPGNIENWVTDHEGKIRLAQTTDGVNSTLLFRETEAQPFKPVLTTTFREKLTPLFFTFDNKMVYAASNIGRDKEAIVKFDPASGQEMGVLFEHPSVDVNGLSYSRKRNVLTSIPYVVWKTEYKFLDPQTEKLFKKIRKKLPKDDIFLRASDKNEENYIVSRSSDLSSGAYYLYEVRKARLTKLADVSPWLNEKEMSDMKAVSYTTRDGLTIYGYLTIPRGEKPKNLPVVVNPHGGPWARDTWRFSSEVQFLANRGFAVFQMNFRGSTGYGRKFWEASFKQWGKKMQDDITDGVNWLIKEGIADPRRIAIYGGSYGGYATLAGVTFTPDLYACGIDYVGVSNLFTFIKTVPPYWKSMLEMFAEMIGDPEKDKEMLHDASPVFFAHQIKVPMLVAQGAQDPRVNIDESNQIVEALKKNNLYVEYMVKENEGHGFHNEENRFDFYEAMEKFLKKFLLEKNSR